MDNSGLFLSVIIIWYFPCWEKIVSDLAKKMFGGAKKQLDNQTDFKQKPG